MLKLLNAACRMFLTGVLLIASGQSASRAANLAPAGATWKYFKGRADPSPGSASGWRQRAFADAAWPSGAAPFSYGEPEFAGTALSDMQGSYTTLFLRRTFTVANPSSITELQLHAWVDDGFVAWINGVQVAATNAPASPTRTSVATTSIEPFEAVFDLSNPSYLVAGENVLAVVVLNGAISSSDLVFDAELTSIEKTIAAPSVLSIDPAPGFVPALNSIAVTFTEPVTGVRAGDFLINGAPAASVNGAGARYVFGFPQPAYGPVEISWGGLHTIVDLDVPPQKFDAGQPGATWAYQLTNPEGPAVTTLLPIPGTTLRQLAQVEVNFNRPVSGIAARDLLVNGVPAAEVSGVGAGPYRFSFPKAPNGAVNMDWNPSHQIVTEDPEPARFAGTSWSYTVNDALPAPGVVINEIVAENQTGLADEDRDPEDWIELYNPGSEPVNLGGWSLSVDREEEGQWVFPSVTLPAGGYLVVFASGKDRRAPALNQRFHANFKLNPTGDTLRLFGPDLPRTLVDELEYPEQSPNYPYARLIENGQAMWRFSDAPSPGAANPPSTLAGGTEDVYFSVERGFFNAPFGLTLVCETPGAVIRYTTNGSVPAPTNGIVYSEPIQIASTRIIRAAAFAPQRLPSRVRTHTYLMNLASNRRLMPVLSLVTATNNLYGRNGIMEYNPRNTTKHGAAWERPVSVEWIRPNDNGGFQLDAGVRVAGGDYIRGLYNYRSSSLPESKYSFRLYFRGDYGPGRLRYPVFPGTTLESFNTLHLRAGMNDHSNPLLKDEFVRALTLDVGIPACHGTFVYLFLNGVYRGIYNPCERVDDDFLQAYLGGGELWDVLGPNSSAIRGDTTAWSQLRTAARKDLTIPANYLDVDARMDIPNFIDYLLPLIWADNDDWPHNNTRAAREKKPGAKFRFYPWDAEFAFTSHGVSYDTIANTLSTLSPPWGTTDYQAMFNSLKKSPEFKLLFADRVHRAFFNDGPLTDARIRARYNAVKASVAPAIPGFNDLISSWITSRRRYVTNSFLKAGFLASSNAPAASQFGGLVPAGYSLALKNLKGDILYTTNGLDPRVPFSSARSEAARVYAAPLTVNGPLHLIARSLDGTNWSAKIDIAFEVSQLGHPVRITELMYNPLGGDAFEFVELENTGGLAADLSGFSFEGITFRFPAGFPPLAPGGKIVLANDALPAEFQKRYPGLAAAGWFAGSLSNGGERIALIDDAGRTVCSVDYQDGPPWPSEADGKGASLEIIDASGDSDSPGNWRASAPGGSPGKPNPPAPAPRIYINELQAGLDRDWIELHNPGAALASVAGWSLTDNSNPRRFVFAANTRIEAGGFLRVECVSSDGARAGEAPFRLDRQGETIALYDEQTNRVAAVRYGPVVDGFTIGMVQGRLVLCDPTPLGPNEPAALGSLASVVLNEFLANPEQGDDWLELHNTGAAPVSLIGCSIATSNALARIESPVFIGAGGFVVLRADENPGPNHLDLKLPANRGLISLHGPNGAELDRVVYGPQAPEISLGRLPDGAGAWQSLPYSPTPGASNYLADLGAGLRLAEILAHAQPSPDWIEIENAAAASIPLAGHSLHVESPKLARIEAALPSLELRPNARVILYFGSLPPGFNPIPGSVFSPSSLPEDGGLITLRDARGRIIDRLEYRKQIPNRSIGRAGAQWSLLSGITPGQPNSEAAALDAGQTLRINEWLAAGGGTNDFVELFNPAPLPVHLQSWVITDDPSMRGATNNRLGELFFIDAGGFLKLNTDGESDLGPLHTSFRLNRLGETLRLLDPSGRIIDTLDYAVQIDQVSEGRYPDGSAVILRFPGSTSPGAPNFLLSNDADADGLDDDWERRFGFDPAFAGDAALDADNDGVSNEDEFLAGTDPRNPTDQLRALLVITEGGRLGIRFTAQPARAYQVEASDALGASQWRVLGNPAVENTAREVTVVDPDRFDQRSTRFYRIRLQR